MELSWPIRLRIGAVALAGIILLGVLCQPLAAPNDPFDIVCLKNLTVTGMLYIGIIAVLCGLLGYFLSWPYGSYIGVLAVPFGLAVWALQSGSIGNRMQIYPALQQREQIFSLLRFESVFWLIMVILGFAGVFIGYKFSEKYIADTKRRQKISESIDKLLLDDEKPSWKKIITALFVSLSIASLCIFFLAQNVKQFDEKTGWVIAQPSRGQIAFSVVTGFLAAAFIVKKFLNLNYIWPVITTAFVNVFFIIFYANNNNLTNLASSWPSVFLANPIVAILPIQMVCFGTIGAIAGYWLAIRFAYWRETESS